jgi:hypothetical protein
MRKLRAICYPSGPATGRGCFPESRDKDGCYPGAPAPLADLLRLVASPPRRGRQPQSGAQTPRAPRQPR